MEEQNAAPPVTVAEETLRRIQERLDNIEAKLHRVLELLENEFGAAAHGRGLGH